MHPIKLTASLIEYDVKTKCLKMECTIFMDDFEKSINKTLEKNINLSNLSKEDMKGIGNYFGNHFKIILNSNTLPIKYESSEVLNEYNIIRIKFKDNGVKIKKGDKLLISNALFFTEFGSIQSNRMTIRIPPFVVEDNHESTLNNNRILYTF